MTLILELCLLLSLKPKVAQAPYDLTFLLDLYTAIKRLKI
jgi:hypothetical protein